MPMSESSSLSSQRYYLPQLDGLRFFAFLLVFIHHFWKPQDHFEAFPWLAMLLQKVQEFGWMGVDLFLVLSAFLITNLLLLERERYGRISLKDFYVRRTLRIWPLYYFMVLIGFVVSPLLGGDMRDPETLTLLKQHLAPYLIFLGNVSAGFFGYADSRYLSHLWTISLEEQFYILWPLLLCMVVAKRRLLYVSLGALLCLAIYLRAYGVLVDAPHPLIWTNLLTRLDPLVLGCLLAIYRMKHVSDGRFDHLKLLSGFVLIGMVAISPSVEQQTWHILWQYFAVALGFSLIVDSSISKRIYFQDLVLSSRVLVFLGKLCYGLYVYHLFGINIGKKITKNFHFEHGMALEYLVAFSISLLVTIMTAWISYQLIERQFLKLKNRFTRIQSRPE